ncbi:hypothetical protein WA158_005700 [Blastocystis sp. Blastoise]
MFTRVLRTSITKISKSTANSGRFFSDVAKKEKEPTKWYTYVAAVASVVGSVWLYKYWSDDKFKYRMNRDYISKAPFVYKYLSKFFPDIPLRAYNHTAFEHTQSEELFSKWFVEEDSKNQRGLNRGDIVDFIKRIIPQMTDDDAQEIYNGQDLAYVLSDYRMPPYKTLEGRNKTVSIDEACYFLNKIIKKYSIPEEQLILLLQPFAKEQEQVKEIRRVTDFYIPQFLKEHNISLDILKNQTALFKQISDLGDLIEEKENEYESEKWNLQYVLEDEKEMYKLPKDQYTKEDIEYYKEQKKDIQKHINSLYYEIKDLKAQYKQLNK